MSRIIMHIDVNNAFLSWSAVYYLKKGSKIDIRNIYAVIGGDEKKRTGIVLAKSTPAKKKGVVTGETLFSARKKCPGLRNYPMNYKFYKYMSTQLFKIISKYSPDIEVASIDECYLDYTNIKKMYGDELEFAKKLQQEIYDTLGFTVNIGIANNKLCAKMASDFTKPNKIHTLYEDEVINKMWPLPIEDLFTVGKKSSEKLRMLNINTIKDLATVDPLKIYPYFKNQTNYYIDIANGKDDSLVNSKWVDYKGIGNEITLEHDIDNISELLPYVDALSEKVTKRLRKEKKYAYVVCVIIKDNKFKRKSHQKKLMNPISSSKEVYEFAKIILKEMWDDDEVRLIGIRLDNLCEEKNMQISLFDKINETNKNEKIDIVIDSLKEKYGKNIISKAGAIKINDRND